jgi:hypothetical protein
MMAKHQKRLDWVRQHLSAVLDWMALDPAGDWQVHALFVVDLELFTPYLREAPIPVVSVARLASEGLL